MNDGDLNVFLATLLLGLACAFVVWWVIAQNLKRFRRPRESRLPSTQSMIDTMNGVQPKRRDRHR